MGNKISLYRRALWLGFLMFFIIPGIIHTLTEFKKTGFTGLGVERLHFNYLLVILVAFLILFYMVVSFVNSKHYRSSIFKPLKDEDFSSKPFYLEICLSILTLLAIIKLFYGDIYSILLMRSGERYGVDFSFEIIRAFLLSYLLINFRNFLFNKGTIRKLLSLLVFFLLFVAVIGFGSRNLLVYPLVALFYYSERNSDRFHRRARKVIFLFIAILAIGISSFRDSGIGTFEEIELSDTFLAFDQMNATLVILSDKNNLRLGSPTDILRMWADFWLHLVPRPFFDQLGLEKNVHLNWLSWNEKLTSRVDTNITPGMIGQGYLEGGILGVIFFPFLFFLQKKTMLTMFQKLVANDSYRDIISILFIGGAVNAFRHFSVGYFVPAIIFAVAIGLTRLLKELIVKLVL